MTPVNLWVASPVTALFLSEDVLAARWHVADQNSPGNTSGTSVAHPPGERI